MNLPRARFTPPANAGASPLAFAGPVALGALLVAGAWCAWEWTRPLATTTTDHTPAIPALPDLALHRATIDERADRLARLATHNPFDDEHAFWVQKVADAPDDDAPEPSPRDIQPPPRQIQDIIEQARASEPVRLTAEEDLSDNVKKARDNLELRGLFVDRAGTPVAMIGYKQSKNRGSTLPSRPGESFVDPSNNQAPWVLARIETGARRVVLVRSGNTIALDLYPDAPFVARTDPDRPVSTYTPSEGTPTIEARTRDEIVADLRAGQVSERDILAVLQLMDIPAEGIETPVTIVNQPEPLDPEAVEEATTGAPGGLEDLLKFMAEGNERRRKAHENNDDN